MILSCLASPVLILFMAIFIVKQIACQSHVLGLRQLPTLSQTRYHSTINNLYLHFKFIPIPPNRYVPLLVLHFIFIAFAPTILPAGIALQPCNSRIRPCDK